MTRSKVRYAIKFIALLLVPACGSQPTVVPTDVFTATLAPTSTSTLTSTPSPSPTSTLTPIPSDTLVPLPASLVGTVLLSNGSVRPFASLVELRIAESFDLVDGVKTSSTGEYKLEDILPGKYELWVLITSKPTMVVGCSEVRPPDNTWKIGINFEGDKGLTMENAYLSKALLLTESLQGSGLQAKGLYAVLSEFEILSGIENKFDVTLYCE